MPHLVLDTNVVLDLYYWQDEAAAPLLTALADGSASAVTDARCFEELQHVLRLDRFALDADAQQALAQRYRDACRWHDTPPLPTRSLPRCKDPDDQKFLELALAADADLLVTKDKALLALARRRQALGKLAIVTPPVAARRLAEIGAAAA